MSALVNSMKSGQHGLLLLVCLYLSACMSYEPRQLAPALTLSGEVVSLAQPDGNQPRQGADLGMTLSLNESDSLTNITILPGVRVRTVAAGGPAELAGIRAGDVILQIDGRETNHPDVVAALAMQISEPASLGLQVRRDTTVFATSVQAAPVGPVSTPVELFRSDPLLTRAGYSTILLEDAEGRKLSGARIEEFQPLSLLPQAGLRTGDIILRLEGQAIGSAQGLVTYVHNNHVAGDKLAVDYLRQGQPQQTEIQLWTPGRKLNTLRLWPLFDYESTLSPDRTSLEIIDLWLFSLFSYQRQEDEKSWQLFGILRGETGFGELQEGDSP